MATRNGSSATPSGNYPRKNKKKQKRKIIIFAVEIVVILLMIGVLYFVMNSTKESEGPIYASVADLEPIEIGISEEVVAQTEEGGAMSGYLNIAFFGLDAMSTKSNDLLKGYRSDSIMICSINQETYEVKLVSVYRDTYMNLGNDSYNKCNGAYAKGGATQAISMLNSNLDLDITNWISVSYKALSEAIDSLGGIPIDVDSAELEHINSYQIAIADIMKCDYTPVTSTGLQTLNGIQAAAYCRIRYTAGDDFKRAERQREVLQAMLEKAKTTDVASLTSAATSVLNNTYTSLDSDTVMEIVSNVNKYKIVAEDGFPTASLRTTATVGSSGSCVIPLSLESNVVWLHQFLFDDTDYNASSTVKNYSAKIKSDTDRYIQ